MKINMRQTFSITSAPSDYAKVKSNQDFRLEIFKAAVSSNLQIDEDFFPFLQQAFEFVTTGEVEKMKLVKKD